MCSWAVPSTCPPSPRAAAASPLNAREPEPEPELPPALRLLQHPGPPQSPHVTSDCPIIAAPAHIKGAGGGRAPPPGCPGGFRSAPKPYGESSVRLVENASHLGCSVVAINHAVDFKEKKQEIENPVAVSELFTTLPIVWGKSRPIRILTRPTIIISDPSHYNVLRAASSRVRLYDSVAVFPKTEKLFHAAYTHLDVDLFLLQKSPLAMAIDRGIGFEIVYSPAIKDSTMRRYTISNALNLMQVCKEKDVIISSAVEGPLEIRRPYDVANLGLLFGLSESDAKAVVSTNSRATLLLHRDTRKTAFEIVSKVKKPRSSEGDDDSLPACKKAKCKS
ncbi:LOW QUALITY PROTEIN: ribonuclease P protein subunit p30-like [Trichechus manatus latirostris]|uniref:Ribonuclease P protein subunit p30 n=1 Tax=Trichechus manatus latirostris TaxID=127582 RepID=A0A2Y9FX93_TRIMA|nr:LOW QUALITY PROTEIN: ribonuclease P protein subunit p30-like [Trichechus manatus latirostris]